MGPAGQEPAIGVVHQLYAEAIEGLMPAAQSRAIHHALADALPHPAEQAWHREAAFDFPGARAAHVRAAAESESLEPGGTTLLHYERALELAEVDEERSGVAAGSPGTADHRVEASASPLLGRAAQAAFVAGSFRRAAGLIEQAIDQRASRAAIAAALARDDVASRVLLTEVGTLYERLGRARWASGDLQPALSALDNALQVIPDSPSRERAGALAALAQHLMLDGRFADSAGLAEQACAVARAVGDAALAELGHATCTLGVDRAYGGDLDGGLRLLEEATHLARRAGRLDDLMRSYANRTTLLDLDSRREAALAVVSEGIGEARRWGLEAVYGAFLRGNAADCLFSLGRWDEAESECRAALEWAPSGVAWFNPILYLGLLVVESRADEEASRLVGQIMLQLETVPEGQWTAFVQRAAVSLALWHGELADAQQVAASGWERVLQTDDWAQVAMAASTTLEACAAVAEDARVRNDWAVLAAAGEVAQGVLSEAERRVAASGTAPNLGARREAELHLATARGHVGRVRGRPDFRAWDRVADGWGRVPIPYQAAKARWWEALAALEARDERRHAKEALLESWRLAVNLGAGPLQDALIELARRARIRLQGAPEAPIVVPTGRRSMDAPGRIQRPMVPVGPGRPGLPWDQRSGAVSAPSGDDADVARAGVPLASGIPRWPPGGHRGPRSPDRDPDTAWGGERTAVPSTAVQGTVLVERSDTGRAISERLSLAEAPVEHPFGLSPREDEVLAVLSQGRTNREIAERLYISERTVGVHVRRILAKLGVAGRVEAAGVAIRLGLVPDDLSAADRLADSRRLSARRDK